MVYALLVDRVESRGLALLAAGAAVDPDRQRVLFDEWLTEDIKPMSVEDVEKQELLQALGLR